jgi:hypothetical protein
MGSSVDCQPMTSLREEGDNTLDNRVGLAIEAATGYADHLNSMQLQLLLAKAIALEGTTAAMGLVDIEFDGKALHLPIKVKLVPSNIAASRGRGQPRTLRQLEKTPLEA